MASSTNTYKNTLKRTIKTGMHALHIDDATYRDMLEHVTMRVSGKAKNSIKNMTIDELNAVVDEMRKKGFEPRRGKYSGNAKKDNSVRNKDGQDVERPMLGKVQALWITMHKQGFIKDGSDNALNAFVRKQINRQRAKAGKKTRIINLRGANDRELWQLIEALKSWQQREKDKLTIAQLNAGKLKLETD